MRLTVFTTLLCACAVSVGACDSPPPSVNNGQRNLILATGPAGYRMVLDQAQDQVAASRATPADPATTLAQLKGDNFAAGWARTWTKGPESVEILEFAFADQFHSRDFVHYDLLEIAKGTGVLAAPHPTVPDSTIFSFSGKTRAKTKQVFCQGSWFVVAQYAFEVTDCGEAPPFPDLMSSTTEAQYRAATSALGLPAELISPSPTP